MSIIKIFNVLLYSILTSFYHIIISYNFDLSNPSLYNYIYIFWTKMLQHKIGEVSVKFFKKLCILLIHKWIYFEILTSYITHHKKKKSLNNCEGWKYLIYHFDKQLFWQYCHMTHSSMYNIKCCLMWIHKFFTNFKMLLQKCT